MAQSCWRLTHATDVARGLAKYSKTPDQLKTWAWFLLASSSFLELAMEDHPAGDALLNALWDASFGKPVDPETIRLAEELACSD